MVRTYREMVTTGHALLLNASNAIASIAGEAKSLVEPRLEILDVLSTVVEFDIGVLMSAAPGESWAVASKNVDGAKLAEHYWRYATELPRGLIRVLCSGFVSDVDLIDARLRDRIAFYREFSRPAGMRLNLARTWACDGRIYVLGLMRGAGYFRARDVADLNTLFPQLSAATRLTSMVSALIVDGSRAFCEDYNLTPRQRQVVALVSRGLRNAEIANLLGLSTHTVRNCIAGIFTRAHVTNRAELTYLMSSHIARVSQPAPVAERYLRTVLLQQTRSQCISVPDATDG